MRFIKNIGTDLVEKRLWPVALLLVVALVAAPVLLSRGGEDPGAVPPGPPATTAHITGADGSQAEVTLQQVPTTATAPRNRPGKVRDPFARTVTAKPAPAQSGAAGGAPSPSGAGGSAGGSPVPGAPSSPGATPAGGGSQPAPKPAPKPDPLDTYHLRLAFGNTDGKTRTLDDVARLTPLPSAENPFFVFLGVLDDTHKAVFLVSSDAKATGDGTCKPRTSDCETIELAAGETEYFDIVTPGGRAVQYVMHVKKIERQPVAEGSRAAAASVTRHSQAGQDLLRAAADTGAGPQARTHRGMLRYRYVPQKGVLVRARHAARGRSSAAGAEPRIRSAKHQPGVSVFRTRVKPAR